MLESPKFDENDNYDGSRAFSWLADLCGLSVDLVNFLICQITALFLASLYRSLLHPSKVSSAVRHTFALVLGLFCGYFCFGQQAIHIALLPTVCYIVIRTQSPEVVQRSVMIAAMTYLLCMHLVRQIYDYGSQSLDITGPLMIITQKVTSLAFSIHDGFVRQGQQELTKAQQYHAIYKLPSALEYFSYALHFQSLMAGPLVFYKDYIDFIEGYNLLKRPTTNCNMDNRKSELVLEPSPTKAVIKKVIGSMICAFIFMKFVKLYPVKNLKDDDFLENTTILYKFWYAMMATSCIRFKYYHAWLLADAICNNAGLGFTGYDKEGNSKWDLISNINVLPFEFATNMRDAINNWNCGTNRWLRTIVYERVPKKYGTVLTFALSAVWHGFYPGYYLTFATGAVMVTAARVARRMFRHRFQQTQLSRMCYDILTCLTTRLVMGYATFPFVLLEFMGSISLYLKFYLCLHIVAVVIIFILPNFISGEKRSTLKTTNVTSISDSNKGITNDIHVVNNTNDDKDKINMTTTTTTKIATTTYSTDIPHSNDSDDLNDELKNFNKLQKKPHITMMMTTDDLLANASCAREAVRVKHDQCEMDQLSTKLKEKIDAETKNIEEFIDKTVTETVSGIVEFKNDLMRDPLISQDGLRKRHHHLHNNNHNNNSANLNNVGDGVTMMATSIASATTGTTSGKTGDDSSAFLKKEIDAINAVVQQANVLPAVLSNGHAK